MRKQETIHLDTKISDLLLELGASSKNSKIHLIKRGLMALKKHAEAGKEGRHFAIIIAETQELVSDIHGII